MRPGLRLIWESIHEPKVVTIVTILAYFTIWLYGISSFMYHSGPFWTTSAIMITVTAPVSIVASWTGRWQIERPAMFPIAGGLTLNIILTMVYLASEVLLFGYVVMVALLIQVFVSRWVRIRASYVSPARIGAELRQKLDD